MGWPGSSPVNEPVEAFAPSMIKVWFFCKCPVQINLPEVGATVIVREGAAGFFAAAKTGADCAASGDCSCRGGVAGARLGATCRGGGARASWCGTPGGGGR